MLRSPPATFIKALTIGLVLTLFGAAFFFDLQQYLTLDAIKEKQAALKVYQDSHPLFIMAGFFLVYVTAAAISFPGATILTLLGGALFGFWKGLGVVSFASTIGATLAFFLARFLLRDWIQRKYHTQLAALNAGVTKEGSFYLFALRLIPVFPFFLVNILTSVLPIKTRSFYLASQLGMLPGTAVYVYAGTELSKVKSLSDIASPALLAAFALLGLFPLIAKKIVAAVRNRRVS